MKLCKPSAVIVFGILFCASHSLIAEEGDSASSVPVEEQAASEPEANSPDTTKNQTLGSTAETEPPQQVEEPENEEEKDEIFGWFSVAPEVGYVYFPGAEMEYQGFTTTVDPRNGLIAKLHFDLGGDGFAFEIAPIFEIQAGGIEVETDTISGLRKGGSFQAVGGQLSVVYRFKVGYFFPNLGLGFHGTYLMGERILYGTELYGRLPVGFSVYMGKHIALVFEVGLMYGVTGIRTPINWDNLDLLAGTEVEGLDDQAMDELKRIKTTQELDAWLSENRVAIEESGVDPNELYHEAANNVVSSAMRFGRGFGLDITIGLRFP